VDEGKRDRRRRARIERPRRLAPLDVRKELW
jgi:hypothetical protein